MQEGWYSSSRQRWAARQRDPFVLFAGLFRLVRDSRALASLAVVARPAAFMTAPTAAVLSSPVRSPTRVAKSKTKVRYAGQSAGVVCAVDGVDGGMVEN